MFPGYFPVNCETSGFGLNPVVCGEMAPTPARNGFFPVGCAASGEIVPVGCFVTAPVNCGITLLAAYSPGLCAICFWRSSKRFPTKGFVVVAPDIIRFSNCLLVSIEASEEWALLTPVLLFGYINK